MICRVFQKSVGGKKTHLSGIMRLDSYGNELGSSGLPPLTDSSPHIIGKTKSVTESAYVPCFSNPINVQRNQGGIFDSFTNTLFGVSSNTSEMLPRIPLSSSLFPVQNDQATASLPFSSSVYNMQDQNILRALLESPGSNLRNGFKTEGEMVSVSQETGLTTDMNNEISSVLSNFEMGKRQFENQQHPNASAPPVDVESFWNY